MCRAGTTSAWPSIAPSSEAQWGLTLIEPPCPYYLDYNRRSRSDGRKLSISSTSRTLATRRGKPSTNLLAGLDAPLACAPSRQTPSPRNSWRRGHTGLGAASSPGCSRSCCPTCGRFLHLKVTVSLNRFRPEELDEARKVSGIGFHHPGVYTPRRVGSQICVLRRLHFLHAPTQNSKDLEKSTNNCDP